MIRMSQTLLFLVLATTSCRAHRKLSQRNRAKVSPDSTQVQSEAQPSPKRRRTELGTKIYFGVVGTLVATSVALLFLSSHFVYQIEKNVSGPFCFDSQCNGKNPEGTNCLDDAIEVRSEPVEIPEIGEAGTLSLKYSEKCQANWVRWIGEGDNTDTLNNPQVWQADAPDQRIEIASQFHGPSSGFNTWSGMISARGDTCMDITFSYVDNNGNKVSQSFGEICTEGLTDITGE